jgi:hypothetical protein
MFSPVGSIRFQADLPGRPPHSPSAPATTTSDATQDVGRLRRYLTFVPLVGPGVQAYHGVREVKNHDKRNGYIDIGLGALNFTGDVSATPIYFSFVRSLFPHPIMLTLGVVAGASHVLNAAVDGGRDIYNARQAVKAGQVDRRAYHGEIGYGAAKIAAGGVVAAGAVTLHPGIMLSASFIYGIAAGIQNRHRIATLGKKVLGMGQDAPTPT